MPTTGYAMHNEQW